MDLDERRNFLEAAVRALRPLFVGGLPCVHLTAVRPSWGYRGPALGLSWDECGCSWIWLNPEMTDPVDLLAVLLHELAHCAVGPDLLHGPEFRKAWRRLGFVGRPTEATPGLDLALSLEGLARRLGVV